MEIPLPFFKGKRLFAIVMVDYGWLWLSIGGFSWVELGWLATSTARAQVSDYSQLSDYTDEDDKRRESY